MQEILSNWPFTRFFFSEEDTIEKSVGFIGIDQFIVQLQRLIRIGIGSFSLGLIEFLNILKCF